MLRESITGTWVSEIDGTVLVLTGDGRYEVRAAGAPEGSEPLMAGTVDRGRGRVSFTSSTGPCAGETGVYTFTPTGEGLRLDYVQDPCAERLELLSAGFSASE